MIHGLGIARLDETLMRKREFVVIVHKIVVLELLRTDIVARVLLETPSSVDSGFYERFECDI